jgi:iron complex transport system substrate-binding protein
MSARRCAFLRRLEALRASFVLWLALASVAAHNAARADTAGAASASTAITVRDDLGRELRLLQPPRRIVSLLPSLTETVCELGACARLVGTDAYSNWPEEVKALPKTGGLEDAQIESIVTLHPDLVLLSHSQRITDRLSELGIESFALETKTYASIARTVGRVGTLLGVPERAAALIRKIDAAVEEEAAQALAHRHEPAPLVYFEVDPGPYAAGPDSFIGEMLIRLGTRNIVTRNLGPFPKLNPEYVVRSNPDVIFISPTEAPLLGERPGWSGIRAVKEHRLCSFEPAVRDTIIRPGPRVAAGVHAMSLCLARVAP